MGLFLSSAPTSSALYAEATAMVTWAISAWTAMFNWALGNAYALVFLGMVIVSFGAGLMFRFFRNL